MESVDGCPMGTAIHKDTRSQTLPNIRLNRAVIGTGYSPLAGYMRKACRRFRLLSLADQPVGNLEGKTGCLKGALVL